MTRKDIEDIFEGCDDDYVLFADGFDDAIIGMAIQFNQRYVAYDYKKCLTVLMDRDKMSEDEAIEYMEFNVLGSYVGEKTPVFICTE